MLKQLEKIGKVTGIVLGALVLVILLWWLRIMMSSNAFNVPLASWMPWPVACHSRGCVTVSGWHKHYQSRLAFATITEQEVPTPEEALTTLLRQDLVRHTILRMPITHEDAKRYREEVLGLDDGSLTQKSMGMSLVEYDSLVILPLLQQEVLKSEQGIETYEELYKLLSAERRIVVLPRLLKWDKDKAVVVRD